LTSLSAADKDLLAQIIGKKFNPDDFKRFLKEWFDHNALNFKGKRMSGGQFWKPFRSHFNSFEYVASYRDPNDKVLPILIAKLTSGAQLERARTRLRNFAVHFLKDAEEQDGKNWQHVLIAFYTDERDDWRLSFIERGVELKLDTLKAEEFRSPAQRYSFLIEEGNSHTAQKQLAALKEAHGANPTIDQIKDAFPVEKVSRQFFEAFRSLYDRVRAHLEAIEKKEKPSADEAVWLNEVRTKGIDTPAFAQKLLSQVVFVYFLQRKKWLGAAKEAALNDGNPKFLQSQFYAAEKEREDFMNTRLKQLFYQALAERPTTSTPYNKYFKCQIPFLNGGLFEPMADFDWQNVHIPVPNELFRSKKTDKHGVGLGILDVFDTYNFTVRENDPLEQEVAVDPKMLGEVFERLLDVAVRKEKGTFYTVPEIVHYMSQQSLIYYLHDKLNQQTEGFQSFGSEQTTAFPSEQQGGQTMLETPMQSNKVPYDDIQNFIVNSGNFEFNAIELKKDGGNDYLKLPASIQKYAPQIDQLLADIKICDPAVGSGAFPVGMMLEIVSARRALYEAVLSDLDAVKYDEDDYTHYALKLNCITNSIYAVDIAQMAIDVAKLRLWLSLVVDEESHSDVEPLPNLDYKIVQGNSLKTADKDLEYNSLTEQLRTLTREYVNESNSDGKKDKRDKIQGIIKKLLPKEDDFDFRVYFSEVFVDDKGKVDQSAGFDVLIANPPYGGEKISKEQQKDLRLGSRDVYGAFIARCLGTGNGDEKIAPVPLRNGGFLSFIVSDTFMTIGSHLKLRQQMLRNRLYAMIRLHPNTFKATVNTAIVFAQRRIKNPPTDKNLLFMADMTRIDATKRYGAFTSLLRVTADQLVKPLTESSEEHARYIYPQKLIETCTHIPFFQAWPKLFTLMNDTDRKLQRKEEYEGKTITVRDIEMNGKTVTVTKLGEIAEVRVGLQTGDNKAYLFQEPTARGSYRSMDDLDEDGTPFREKLLTETDLDKIRNDEELRLAVIEQGISKKEKNSPRYFGGRYIIPHDKGGASDSDSGWLPNYYVPTEYFIDWSEWAVHRMKTFTIDERIRLYKQEAKITDKKEKQIAAVFRNINTYFETGVCYSTAGVYAPTFRAGSASVYGHRGTTIFSKLDKYVLLGYLATIFSKYLIKNLVNHTVAAEAGTYLCMCYLLHLMNHWVNWLVKS